MNPTKDRINTNPEIMAILVRKNKNFPNSALPVLVYKAAVRLPAQKNKAADLLQQLFLKNSWKNTWRDGIYHFHHYHSTTHECMGICAGRARIILGGPNGRPVSLEPGDIILLPAGVAHKCTSASKDFLCMGAYPLGKDYDINLGKADELEKALPRLRKLGVPKQDPLYGKQGFLKSFWG